MIHKGKLFKRNINNCARDEFLHGFGVDVPKIHTKC